MLRSIAIGVAVLAAGSASFCQTVVKANAAESVQKVDLCKTSEMRIEAALKELAYAAYSGSLDNSAPRATIRKLTESVALSKIQVQLTYMQMLACQAPKSIEFDMYSVHAIGCVMAPAGNTAIPCDQAKWSRDALPK